MFYFLPAWKDINVDKFDDTLSQIKMFLKAEEPMEIWTLNYLPRLHTFLFLEGIDTVKVRSFYDRLQNIQTTTQKKIDVYDFNWPIGSYFAYSQFAIFVLNEGKRIASLHFDELNNLKFIDHFNKEQKIERKSIFDDRGFVSSIELYENDVLFSKQFYNEFNQLQFTVRYDRNQEVELSEENAKRYGKTSFASLHDWLMFVWLQEVQKLKEEDVLVIAMDNEVPPLFEKVACKAHVVLSAFSKRPVALTTENSQRLLQQAELLMVDNQEFKQELTPHALQTKIEVLTPYDAILRLGESQYVKYLQVHYVMGEDDLTSSQQVLEYWIQQCIAHEDYRVVLQCKESYQVEPLREKIKMMLINQLSLDEEVVQEYLEELLSEQENRTLEFLKDKDDENNYLMFGKLYQSITVAYYNGKEELLEGLLHTRIIVDLQSQPDTLLQICGISSGIPMINRVDTGYVIHKKNGLIISSNHELDQALEYYLNGLKHWNEALVYSVAQLNRYTNGAIVHQWKERLSLA
ncbi:accessory Sec system protein Asp1 [Enterococcus cecorum]|uniref:Accessory Sec system protein Asp1 n=1 Tax=Enterococcus cecorum TaxID=44008 RepID=A0A200HQS1_9ENTE|nr:accessory Sec system protein Asp1 [Enterococcus cecorum]OUZ15064.1 accessory Sec system protein Asp1 [Enterococcus cecorum]